LAKETALLDERALSKKGVKGGERGKKRPKRSEKLWRPAERQQSGHIGPRCKRKTMIADPDPVEGSLERGGEKRQRIQCLLSKHRGRQNEPAASLF